MQARLTPANAPHCVREAHVVLDAADSLAVTYMLSDACQAAGTPLVSASVLGLAGYVGVFCGGAPSYRAVFPEMPRAAGSCAERGCARHRGGGHRHAAGAPDAGAAPEVAAPVLGRLVSLDFHSLHVGGFSFAGRGRAGRRGHSPSSPRQQVRRA